MNSDVSTYVPVRMTEAQIKEYRAAALASGAFYESGPPPDPATSRLARVNYNPVTDNYTLEYQTEMVWGPKDKYGNHILDCDDYSEPDEPDRVYDSVPPPSTRASEDEKADKKRKKKIKKKMKKKIQAPNIEEPKDNASSPTTTRSETLADKNLDPSASTASEDEKADKKRKRTNKTKKKIQATNLEEPKDNTSSPTTMRNETLADKNLDPCASTASEDEKANKKRKRTNKTKNKMKKKKIQPKDNTSSPTRSKSIETLAEKNLDPVMDPSASTACGTQFQPHMNQILGVMRRCNHCRPLVEDLVTSGIKPEAEG